MGKESNTFKLWDLMLNSWFYKLKNIRNRRNRAQKAHDCSIDKSQIPRTEPLKSPSFEHHATKRLSYYISSRGRAAEQLSPTYPRKSKKNSKTQALCSSALSLQTVPGIALRRHNGRFDEEFIVSDSDSVTAEHNLPLPPMLTERRLITRRKHSSKQGSLFHHGSTRSPSGNQPIKLKIKSPKLVQKRVAKRKGLADSFVVVKSSSDPRCDFRESMVDMIVENKFFSWKALEELLACYLLLNSSEHHDLIVEVFVQICFVLSEIIV